MSRILTTVATIAATTLMSSTAFAGCNSGTYCNSGSSLTPLSSWSGSSSMGTYSTPTYSTPSYSSSSSYTSGTSYSSGSSYLGNSYSGVLSSAAADAKYGTGSISSPYEGGNVELFGFSGSTTSVPGLGSGESLQSTNCPVNVYNPSGARVLGCYNVVKQVPQTNYVRVVRPIVYVRYPVPTAVPVPYYVNQNVNSCGATRTNFSRYGGYNNQGFGGCGQGFSGVGLGFGNTNGLLGTGLLGSRGLLGIGALGL